jgi:hypothetical protein
MKRKSLKILLVLLSFWVTKPSLGQIWKPLGQGFSETPVAVTTDGSNIYFAFVDSVNTSNNLKFYLISRWNGVFWQNISSFIAGKDSRVNTIASYKNKIYVGGFFDTVYFSSSRTGLIALEGKKWVNAAKRDRNDLSALHVTDLHAFEGYLYLTGRFNRIDDNTKANGLARFDGTKWQGFQEFEKEEYIGNGNQLIVHNDSLFISGIYKRKSSGTHIPLFKIKGGNIEADSTSPFFSIAVMQGGKEGLFAIGQNNNSQKIIYTWQNGTWQERGTGFPNLQASVIRDATFFDGEYWAAGVIDMGNGEFNHIIKWNGSKWETLGDLNLPAVRFIKNFRDKLYVTGGFVNFRRIRLNRIAEYDKNLALITGRAYYDQNNNCKFDAGEKPIIRQVIRLFNGLFVTYTDREGIYTFIVPKSGTYSINTIPKKYFTLSGCNPAQYIFTPSNSNLIIDTADFAFRLDETIEDVSVKILPNAGHRFRRGFTELYTLTYQNNGGKLIQNGKIRLKLDDSLQGFVAVPAPSSISNGIAEWDYSNLPQGAERTIFFRGKVSSQNTNQISFSAEAVSTNDAFTQDNFDTLDQKVEDATSLGGKFIFPEPRDGDTVTIFPSAGQQEVEYLIRFENKTDDTVRQVIVIDTIDLNLSLEYIQELGASHPYTTQVVNLPPQLGKGVLIWTFDNINLPPNPTQSNDFVENRGHIRFKVRLNSQIEKGVLVTNKADVIYDFADYESTNHVFCKVDDLLSTNNTPTELNQLKIYPNPTSNLLTIQLEEYDTYTLTIIDKQGKQVLPQETFTGSTKKLNVSSLASGIYYIGITNNKVQYFQKLIKQ